MRLIDADRLKNDFCVSCNMNGMCDMPCSDYLIIDAQPTAYDIAKVVEQIENAESPFISRFKAIDIIRNGGKE